MSIQLQIRLDNQVRSENSRPSTTFESQHLLFVFSVRPSSEPGSKSNVDRSKADNLIFTDRLVTPQRRRANYCGP